MHISSISLTDYQSHKRTRLPLGPFTVIVGSSSSGKSAVVRAIRLVAQNARGTDYVRHGQKRAQVSVEFSDLESAPTVVSISRGKGVSEYELTLPGAEAPRVFTKCSTTTPDELSATMGLGDPALWLAGQFDRPFLLDETGSAVAQVLGKLTNVTMIYAAVRECNRRASEIKRKHKDQSEDLDSVRREMRAYATLPVRLAAGRLAEAAVDRASMLLERSTQLADRLVEAEAASSRAAAARSEVRPVPPIGRLAEVAGRREGLTARLREVVLAGGRRSAVTASLRQVPDAKILELLVTRRANLVSALRTLDALDVSRQSLRSDYGRSLDLVESAKEQFVQALTSAGNCPLCGALAASAQVDNVV